MGRSRNDGTHSDDGGHIGRRRARKDFRTTVTPDQDVVPRLVEIKGIGRNSKSRYCDGCGHPTGRCICHVPDEAA